jgi:hypothetical protein
MVNKQKESIKMVIAFNHLMLTVDKLSLPEKPLFQDINEHYTICKEVAEMEQLIELAEAS